MAMIVNIIALLITLAFVSTASAATQCVTGCWYNNVFHPTGSMVSCPLIAQNCIGRDIPGQCCPEEFCGCTRNGIDYAVGDQVPSLDTCNTCWCDGNNLIACTEMACTPETPEDTPEIEEVEYSEKCIQNGIIYQPGDSVPSLDTCNHCWCDSNNSIACSELDCSSVDPEAGQEAPMSA